jgi:uncharacterized LabA/DUF88 family protein
MLKSPPVSDSNSSLTHAEKAEPLGDSFSIPDDSRVSDLLRHLSPVVTAVLVDAEFFLIRSRRIFGPQSPDGAAKKLHRLALEHLNDADGRRTARLYRIFVYDAPPAAWRGHKPISKEPVDIFLSPTAQWRREFHETLRGLRKVALRMGEVPTNQAHWQMRSPVLKDLIDGVKQWTDLSDDDFRLDLRQKGVDMRLGLDIAALAFKRQVNQIVLISGDVDFVPAAKLARREGIDFILDPMWATIRSDLYEHVDGLRTVCPKPVKKPEVAEASE